MSDQVETVEKPLTKSEARDLRDQALRSLECVPKGEFIERFGGDYKVYLNWAKRWAFPWPEDSDCVNVPDIIGWYRQQTASRKGAANFLDVDDPANRLKKAKADFEELRVARLRGEMVAAVDVERDFQTYGKVLREAIETIELVSPEAHAIMVEALDKLEALFEQADADSETDS